MFEGQNIHLSPIDGKRLCSFSQKICKQHRLNGYAFCIRHILEDKNAPFKRCQFKIKANGEKCFNPVPASADRIYCSSHLQVLGMIPKNPTKQVPNKRKMAALKNKNKKGSSIVSKKAASNKRSAVTQKINKNAQKIIEGEYDNGKTNWYAEMRKVFKRTAYNLQAWQKQRLDTEVYDFLSERKYQKRNEDFFKVHKIDDSDVEECDVDVDSTDVSQTIFLNTNERVHHNLLRHDAPNIQEQKMLLKLRHRQGQLKQVVSSNMKKASLSYSVLSKLISSARKSAVQTSNVLNLESGSTSTGSFRLYREKMEAVSYQVPCSLLSGDARCSKLAMPYSRYCPDHISRDGDQHLFASQPCIHTGPSRMLNFLRVDVPSGSTSASSSSSQTSASGQCKRKGENPSTSQSKRSHQRLKSSVEEKKLKKKSKTNRSKPKKTSKRQVNSIRNEMQKKFGIPVRQPVQKLNAHLKKSSGTEEEREDDDDDEDTAEVIVKQEEVSNSGSEEDDENEDILTPEEAFHLPPGSLSFSPRMVDDDAMPIQNRKLEDDDDELLRCTSNFPFDSNNQLPRDITSPTLNQLSSTDFSSSFNNMFMSPAKTIEPVQAIPADNKKTNYQQAFSPPVCRPNTSPNINNRLTQSSQPVVGMVNDQKSGSNMLKISHVDVYNKQPGKVQDNTMYNIPKQLHADRNSRNNSFNSISNNSMHNNNKMMTQYRNNEMTPMGNNHAMNVSNEPMNTYTHMPGGVPNRSHNIPPIKESIGYEEGSLSKRYLSDSLLMQQPLSQDSTLFDDINTDVESPLEKVNPDIFFSSVFPVSTSSEGI